MSIKIPETSGEMIISATEAIFYIKPNFDIGLIGQYMHTADVNAINAAIDGAVVLGFLRHQGPIFEPINDVLRIETHADSVGRKIILRQKLESFDAFRVFKERIFCGDSPLEAADRVKILFDISNDSIKIKEIFLQWGIYANSFSPDQIGNYKPTASHFLVNDYVISMNKSLESIEQARIFISNKLGDEIFNKMPQDVIDNLTSSLIRCHQKYEPRSEIVFAIGTSMEKVLAMVAVASPTKVNLSSAKGLIQMTNELRKNNIITSKHVGLINSLGAVRNAG